MCNIYQTVFWDSKKPNNWIWSLELICQTYVFQDILEQFGEIKHYNIFKLDGNQVWIEIHIFLSAHVLHCYKHFWETLLRRLENTYLAHDWEIQGQEKRPDSSSFSLHCTLPSFPFFSFDLLWKQQNLFSVSLKDY